MSSEVSIRTGNIKWLDTTRQNGIIALVPGAAPLPGADTSDIYFDFKDIEVGSPRIGQMVQFTMEPNPLGPVARKVQVVSDVARAATKRAM